MDNTPKDLPFEPKQPASDGQTSSSGRKTPALTSFGEIAALCANRSSRTIIENENWHKREWEALGKLLEALFAARLGEVRICSEGMTEADAIAYDATVSPAELPAKADVWARTFKELRKAGISLKRNHSPSGDRLDGDLHVTERRQIEAVPPSERKGSLSGFIQQRFMDWLGVKFQLGVNVRRPRNWRTFYEEPAAQALADAYVRPLQIETSFAEAWLHSQNIRLPSFRSERPVETRPRGKAGRPAKKAERLQVERIIERLSEDPQKAHELLGPGKPSRTTLAKGIISNYSIKIAFKTVTNRYGRKLQGILDALN